MASIIVDDGRAAAGGAPRPGASWGMVAALTVVAMLSMFDKYSLSLLIQPIKASLELTDGQVGIAVSGAFAVANILASVPAGWAADGSARRSVVAAGVVIWSLAAAACGLAGGFWQFAAARAAVGFGEGLIPPASYSLIRDGVDTERRARAFAVYAGSNTFGPGLALVFGGLVIAVIASLAIDRLPLIGAVRPWQTTLIFSGCAGLPLALLAFAFRDPGRGAAHDAVPTGFADALRAMRRRPRLFGSLAVYSCAAAMAASALGIWFPAFVGRKFGLMPPQIGGSLGLMLLVLGPAGLLLSGSFIDRAARVGRQGAGIAAAVTSALLLVFATLVPQVGAQGTMWLLEAGVLLTSTTYLCVVSVVVSAHADGRVLGKVMALLLLLQGLLGVGLAPAVVGVVADRLPAGPAALSDALSLVVGVTTLVALVAAWRLHVALSHAARLDPAAAMAVGGV